MLFSLGGLQVLFSAASSCENGTPERPQTLRGTEIKIIFPLSMPRATRRAFKIVFYFHPRSVGSSIPAAEYTSALQMAAATLLPPLRPLCVKK